MERKIGEPIKEADVIKAESEVVRGYREITLPTFKGKENVVVRIYNPNIDDQTNIANAYTETYNNLLFGNTSIPTKKQMGDKLRAKGIWTEADDEKVEFKRKELLAKEVRIYNLLNSKAKKSKAQATVEQDEYRILREELLSMITVREAYYAQTVESKAEEAANLVKIVLCVKYPDGTPVWKSLAELKQERSLDIFDVVSEATYFWNGISREVLQGLPDTIGAQGEDDLEQSQEQQGGNEDTPSPQILEEASSQDHSQSGPTTN